MNRLYLNEIVKWNSSPDRQPLVVWGARQIGKTYLIKELFAEQYYHNKYIYIDCRQESEFANFCKTTCDANKIIQFIETWKKIKIENSVLLIFDEAQECLPLVTSLKYFKQDFPNIPVILTGSMVRLKIKRHTNNRRGDRSFLFPIGCIDSLKMTGITFEEYLLNRNTILYEKIKNCFDNKNNLSESDHTLSLQLFYEYLFVGGLPAAVKKFLSTSNYLETHNVLTSIYDEYLNDMALYQASGESVIRAKKIFKTIYKQLNKTSKNFRANLVDEKLRHRDLISPIDWLTEANLILKSYQLKDHVTPPLIEDNSSIYRLYLSDIGMFNYQSGVNLNLLLTNPQSSYSGIVLENYVAIELNNNGFDLFFWDGKNTAEFEFIIDVSNSIIPIDVKKSRGAMNSLEKFKQHNKYEYAIKISSNKYGFDEKTKILTIPFYMAFILIKKLSKGEKIF